MVSWAQAPLALRLRLQQVALICTAQMASCTHILSPHRGGRARPPQKLHPILNTHTHTSHRKAGKWLYFGQPVKLDVLLREEENRHWSTSSLSSIFLENITLKNGEWAAQPERNHLIQRVTSGLKYLSHHQKGLCSSGFPLGGISGAGGDTPLPRWGLPLLGIWAPVCEVALKQGRVSDQPPIRACLQPH